MTFSRLLRTLSSFVYVFVVLTSMVVTLLTSVFLLSQSVRTSPRQNLTNNFNALVIGATYLIVAFASVFLCMKRRISVRLKLHRISKHHRAIRKADVPSAVHEYITEEYMRTCVVAFESLPKDVHHPGWGKSGSKYGEIYFRRALLDTIPRIDALARAVIPTHPALKPHARMIHHFRFIIPLLSTDEDDLTPLHYYDSAVQAARIYHGELTEEEFELGMNAAEGISKTLQDCWLEMLESSSTRLAASTETLTGREKENRTETPIY